jgi:glycosyltransferase involved in cell wall biosynthesis
MIVCPASTINASFPSLPRVSIIMVVSRQKSHPKYVRRAVESVKAQTWGNLDFIQILNNDRQSSIGTCFNEGVKQSTAKYCLFIGDDDVIQPELVQFLVDFHLRAKKIVGDKLVGSTCHMTFNNEEEGTKGYFPAPFQGMYERVFLLNYRYNTALKHNVDTEHIQRIQKAGFAVACCEYYQGYHYRIHKDMVSGIERFKKPTVSINAN